MNSFFLSSLTKLLQRVSLAFIVPIGLKGDAVLIEKTYQILKM